MAAAAAALLLFPACVRPANLLRNADFLAQMNPGLPDWWGGQSGWRPAAHRVVRDPSPAAGASVRLSNADGLETVLHAADSSSGPAREGASYTFSVNLKAERPGLQALIGGDRLEMRKVTVGAEWSRCSVTAPLKAGKGRIVVKVVLPATPPGVLLVNAPSLERAAESAAGETRDQARAAAPGEAACAGEWILSEEHLRSADGAASVEDSSGNGNRAAVVGGPPAWGPGPAMRFDGRTCLVVPHNALLNAAPGAFSIEILLAPEAAREMPILAKGVPWGGYSLRVSINRYKLNAGGHHALFYGPQALPEPTHLVAALGGGVSSIYVNGELECREETDAALSPRNAAPLVIGGDYVWSKEKGYHPEPGFTGRIALVRVLSGTLSESQAAERYRSLASRLGPAEPPADGDFALLDRSYYSTETSAQVRVHLGSASRDRAGRASELEIAVRDAGGGLKARSAGPHGGGADVRRSVDISSLAAGRYAAAVRVSGPGGEVARFEVPLVKLPPRASGEVKINRFTRMLLVDGAPFIPLVCDVMFWGRRLAGRDVPAGALERFASESGFNTVCIWGSSPYIPENVDDCARLGLKVILFNQHDLAKAYQEGGQEAATKRLVEITQRYRDHPALLAWCQADESNLFADEAHFIERMKLAREADPRHPFFRGDVGWAPGRGAAGGLDTADIFCGSYAGYRLLRIIDRDAVPRGAPTMLFQGLFGPPEARSYPSNAEIVAWAYGLLANGCRALFWWGAHSGMTPVEGFAETMRQLRAETGFLAPILNTPDPDVSIAPDNRHIQSAVKEYGGKYYLVTVNTSRLPQTAVFRLDPAVLPAAGTAAMVFEKTRAAWSGGRLSVRYGPLERRVIELPALPSGR